MVFVVVRNAVFALGLGIAAFGCSGTDSSVDADESTNAQASAVTLAPWGASYVNQSFPLATTTLKMKAGQVIPSYITLKNIGTSTWDSNTRIGTTEPRDRTSVFADSTWVNPGRPSQVTGTVPTGGTFKFTFDLKAPATPGTYDEFFGVVEDGVAWFGDSGQGGPVDNDLEVKIEVSAADPIPDAGHEEDAGDDSGGPISVGEIPIGSDGGDGDRDPGSNPNADSQASGNSGGCTMSAPNSHFKGSNSIAIFFALALAAGVRRRRSR
jgi:hypothetical protein